MGTRNETHINSALQLLQARKEALDRINKVQMRPHGKIMEKDLFTWFGNSIDDLLQTISSFPDPIHWIAKKDEVLQVLDEKEDLLKKLGSIIVYDSTKFSLPSKWVNSLPTYIAVSTLEDALIMSVTLPRQKSVMLITGNTLDGASNDKYINEFITAYRSV
ncbi:MAG: hypothetical protein ACSHXL_01915 [Bacteroidota bacterium]